MQPWIETWRPKEFKDVIGLPSSIPPLVNQEMPNLILEGRAGTGKTTVARIIVKQLDADCLELNASNERGIETVRNKVFAFVSTLSSNNKIKAVFLDEADALTPDALFALRNMMETYSKNARFILSCNYVNKIIDPIKSRCVIISFSSPPKEAILERLEKILTTEKVEYNKEFLKKLVDKKYPDMRGMINWLQGNKDGLKEGNAVIDNSTSEAVFQLLLAKKVNAIRELCIKESLDIGGLYQDLFEITFNSTTLTPEKKKAIIKIIAEDYKWLAQVAEPEILFFGSVMKIIEVI